MSFPPLQNRKLALALVIPLLLGLALYRLTRPDIRPTQIYTAPGQIYGLSMAPDSVLTVKWDQFSTKQEGVTLIDSKTNTVLSQTSAPEKTKCRLEIVARGRDGTKAILPEGRDIVDQLIATGQYDGDDHYAPN